MMFYVTLVKGDGFGQDVQMKSYYLAILLLCLEQSHLVLVQSLLQRMLLKLSEH